MIAVLTSGRGFFRIDLISFDLIMSGSSLVWLSSKESACKAGDVRDAGSVPELGRAPGEGNETLSSILSWKIAWAEDTSRLQFMGLQRVGHN